MDRRLRFGRPLRRGLIALLPACATTGTVHEVEAVFRAEEARAAVAVPASPRDLPGLADAPAEAMPETVAAGHRYLADAGAREQYVRALLACAHLARGELSAAEDAYAGAPKDWTLTREAAVARAAGFAVSAAASVRARAAFEEVLAGTRDVESFLAEHGARAGVSLPRRDTPAYAGALREAAAEVREACFHEGPQGPRELERVSRGRRLYRRLLAEQVYNDCAALLAALPDAPGEPAAGERYLSGAAVAGFCVFGYLVPDTLREGLTEEQKLWRREQAFSTYRRAKRVARRLLRPEDRARLDAGGAPPPGSLYEKLVWAERQVMGWIATR